MPANISAASPSGVFPQTLSTSFGESREFAQLQTAYHDGTIQRAQLAQTSRRTFRLSKRLSSAALATLYSFWVGQNAGLTPFSYYNPFEPGSGDVGSNYDPTGSATQGRYTVKFNGAIWTQVTDTCRTAVQSIELVEVA